MSRRTPFYIGVAYLVILFITILLVGVYGAGISASQAVEDAGIGVMTSFGALALYVFVVNAMIGPTYRRFELGIFVTVTLLIFLGSLMIYGLGKGYSMADAANKAGEIVAYSTGSLGILYFIMMFIVAGEPRKYIVDGILYYEN